MRILDQALKHERYFTALTGLRINEFQRLVEEVTPALRDARLAFLLDRKPMPQRKRQMGGGRKNVFPSVEEQLFLFLF